MRLIVVKVELSLCTMPVILVVFPFQSESIEVDALPCAIYAYPVWFVGVVFISSVILGCS